MRRIILSILFLFLTNSLYAQAVNTNYLCKADIALTNAQIIALPTTPITVVAAPGANKILIPWTAFLHLTWVADYTNIDASSQLQFRWGNRNQCSGCSC